MQHIIIIKDHTTQIHIDGSVFILLKITLTTILLTLPLCLMGRITGAWDYSHVIVGVPGCVTHQMPNPVVSQSLGLKDPVAGQTWPFRLKKRKNATSGKQQRTERVSKQRSRFCHSKKVPFWINKRNLITVTP